MPHKHEKQHCACGHDHDTLKGLPWPLKVLVIGCFLAIVAVILYVAIMHPK